MTKPEEYTIHEIIQMIEGGEIKLPIFQRRYVWSKEQVENLFSTVFNDNPFGAISAIKTTDDYPIFASRTFFEDLKDKYQLSEYNDGQNHSKDNPLYLILDGQQRLQSFYLGLTSKFDDMELCFNKQDGTFKFCTKNEKKEYISVKQLYKKLGNNTYESVAKSFNAENVEIVNKNIFKFYYHFFFQKRIVMLLAYPHNKDKGNAIMLREDKKKLFELFVNLNTGGVNLDNYDICISKLKMLNPQMEELFAYLSRFYNKYPYQNIMWSKEDTYIKQFLLIIMICFEKNPYISEKSGNDIIEIAVNIDIERIRNFIINVFKINRLLTIDIFCIGMDLVHYLYCYKTTNYSLKENVTNYFTELFKQAFSDENSLRFFTYQYLKALLKGGFYDFMVNQNFEIQSINIILERIDNKTISIVNNFTEEKDRNKFVRKTIKDILFLTKFKSKFSYKDNKEQKNQFKFDPEVIELEKAKNEFEKVWEEKEKTTEWNPMIK